MIMILMIAAETAEKTLILIMMKMVEDTLTQKYRNSCFGCCKDCTENFRKILRKKSVAKSYFSNVLGTRPAILL